MLVLILMFTSLISLPLFVDFFVLACAYGANEDQALSVVLYNALSIVQTPNAFCIILMLSFILLILSLLSGILPLFQ